MPPRGRDHDNKRRRKEMNTPKKEGFINIQLFGDSDGTSGTQQNAPTAPTPQGSATEPQNQQSSLSIPKWRFDETMQLYRDTESKLGAVSKELEAAKKAQERVAQLEKEMDDLKKGYELEKQNTKRDSAIDAVIKDKAVDLDVVKKLIDMSKLSFDEAGGLKGLEEQVKILQESKPYLWKKAKPVATPSASGTQQPEKSYAAKLAEKKVAMMNHTAKSKNYFK